MRDFAVAAGIAASAFGIAAAAPLRIYGVMVLVFGAVAVQASKRGRPMGVSKSVRHDPYQSTARPVEVPVSADEGTH